MSSHDAALWSSKPLKTLDSKYKFPDTISTGPRIHFCSPDETNEDILKIESVKHYPCKEGKSEFILGKSLKHSVPINNPQAYKYPFYFVNQSRDDINNTVSGISVANAFGRTFIAYTTSFDDNEVYLSEIKNNEISNNKITLNKLKIFNLDSHCNQVILKSMNYELFCLLKSKSSTRLLKINENFDVSSITRSESSKSSKTSFSNVSFNPILSGHFCLVNTIGQMRYFDAEHKLPVWEKTHRTTKRVYNESWNKIDFGYHYLSMCLCEKRSLTLYDIRGKSLVRPIFDLSSLSNEVSSNSEICNFEKSTENPFYYVITTSSVYLIDERFPSNPVLSWEHMLNEPPNFSSILNYCDKELLLMANSSEKKFSLIANEYPSNCFDNYKSYSFPRHFNCISDTLDYANTQGFWLNHKVKNCVGSDWIGMACNIGVNKTDDFDCFTINLLGDIFHQSFSHLHDHQNKTGITDKKVLSKWENKLYSKKVVLSTRQNFEVLNLLNCKTLQNNIKMSYPDLSEEFYWNLEKTMQSEKKNKKKFWCNTLSEFYKTDSPDIQLKDKANLVDYCRNKFKNSSEDDRVQLEIYKDSLSIKTLAIWNSSNKMQSNYTYECAPLDTSGFKENFQKLMAVEELDLTTNEISQNNECKRKNSFHLFDPIVNEPVLLSNTISPFKISKPKKARLDGF